MLHEELQILFMHLHRQPSRTELLRPLGQILLHLSCTLRLLSQQVFLLTFRRCYIEKEAFLYARRSVTSSKAIPSGAAITRDMLTYKRPGTGISPRLFDLVVGRIARQDIPEDTTITWDMV